MIVDDTCKLFITEVMNNVINDTFMIAGIFAIIGFFFGMGIMDLYHRIKKNSSSRPQNPK